MSVDSLATDLGSVSCWLVNLYLTGGSNQDIQCFFFFNDTATTEIYTLSLHDALPISCQLKKHNNAKKEKM